MTRDRRIGKFSISGKLLWEEEHHKALKSLVFSKMVIVRAEAMYWNDTIEYTAICDDFDMLKEGETPPPTYWVIFNKINERYTAVEFKKEVL